MTPMFVLAASFDLVNLLVVGIIVGILVGGLLPGKGFGRIGNVVLGILGAIVGSFVYTNLLKGKVNLDLGSYTIDFTEVVIALGGALLLALLFRVIVRKRSE